MYLEHFGLREAPFSLTPDPGFFYAYTGHQQALNVLLVALQSGEGFIKITGEVGTGKTLLCRKLLRVLDADCNTAYFPNPLLTPYELHKALARELKIKIPRGGTVHELVNRITGYLFDEFQKGRRTVLCIDEAHVMSDESLDALRLLSNLETEKQKLLQIVVFAQPELNQRLKDNSLRQLRQRITFSYDLPPLDRSGVECYVSHRLQVAGQAGSLFQPATFDVISRSSRGIPRLVNILCHKSLMAAYGHGVPVVTTNHVAAAIADTEDASPVGRFLWSRPVHRWLAAVTAVEAVVLLFLLWRILV